jgi:hypothetical protein
MITKKHSNNMVNAKARRREEYPQPERSGDINTRDYWTKITIEQHSPHGTKTDVVTAFMAYNRIDSSHIKDGDVILMNDKGLIKMGDHRLMAWIAREKLARVGRFE